MTVETEVALLDHNTASVWNYYQNMEACLQFLNAQDDEFRAKYKPATWDEVEDCVNAKFLTGPTAIDEETFYEMLNILPPLHWRTHGLIETFCISEFTIGTITNCYGRYGSKFIVKPVDIKNKLTWVKLKDFEAVYTTA